MQTQSRPVHVNTHVNPTPAYAMVMGEAIQNNNEGLALKQSGMHEAAEQKYLRALDLKLKHIGENAITTALSHNALGELYIAMNRLDDAEKHLKLAVKIRNADGPTFDAATSRENLAVVYEMRGDLKAAKQMRKSAGKYACGNYDVRPILRLPLIASEPDHRSVPRASVQQDRPQTLWKMHCMRLFRSVLIVGELTSGGRPSIIAPRDAR